MKKSLQNKLFIRVILLVIFLEFTSWLIIRLGLEKYYTDQTSSLLMRTAHRIERGYQQFPQLTGRLLSGAERSTGTTLLIINQNFQIEYGNRIKIEGNSSVEPQITMAQAKFDELKANGSFVAITQDPFLNSSFLNLFYLMYDNSILILSTPFDAMQENLKIVNRFFMFTWVLVLIISGAVTFIFARRFTQPILELSGIANSMAHLDFTQKYTGYNDDEVGQLGESINSLSEQLGKSISELSEANIKLKADIEKERRIDEMRKEFVSNVSHELKTPVALIQGYAEGLKFNVMENGEDKEFYCDVIIDESSKMNKLINDLLKLARMESGYFQLEKQEFDLAELIDQILAKYKPIWEEKALTPQLAKPDRLTVYGDILRTEQIIVNYLNNALNHLDDQGILQIRLEAKPGKAWLGVYNSGKNIPEEALDKIFTSFYKVDKARTRAYGGTGLGLSIVRSIQELAHNAYGVVNQPEGVLFWFEIDLEGHGDDSSSVPER